MDFQVKIWFQNRRAKERKQMKKRDELIHKEKLEVAAAAGDNNLSLIHFYSLFWKIEAGNIISLCEALYGSKMASFFFIFVFSIQLVVNTFIKFCQWLDLNRGPLVSKAATLPTEPQPLPIILVFVHNLLHNGFLVLLPLLTEKLSLLSLGIEPWVAQMTSKCLWCLGCHSLLWLIGWLFCYFGSSIPSILLSLEIEPGIAPMIIGFY